MPNKPAVTQPLRKTGSASIDKQGQTTNGRYGSNPDARGKGSPTVRDLNAK